MAENSARPLNPEVNFINMLSTIDTDEIETTAVVIDDAMADQSVEKIPSRWHLLDKRLRDCHVPRLRSDAEPNWAIDVIEGHEREIGLSLDVSIPLYSKVLII